MNILAHGPEPIYLIGGAAAILTALFLIAWLSEPRRLYNGVLFTLALGGLVALLTLITFSSHWQPLLTVYGILALLIIAFILAIVLFGWLLLLINAYFILKYEGFSLANMLTLFAGLALLALGIIAVLGPGRWLPHWAQPVLEIAPLLFLYVGLVMYNFLINSLLYQFVPRSYRQDYLIVLGAGLLQGHRISRLLAARIDRAIAFYHKQKEKGRKAPKLIMSGGQGPDEDLSEAQAMANYAIIHGIPREMILLEDKSRNTQQNMLFSKQLAIDDYGSDHFRAKFFTNNYHLLRAGIYARQAGLAANGVGAHTRFYYLLNAMIREFGALVVMNRKRHLAIIGLIIIVCVAGTIITGI
ncbi:MAG: YdcF family protein [Lactobacillus sp.]